VIIFKIIDLVQWGVQHSARLVEDIDLIEKDEGTGFWRVVDPVFAIWLRKQTEERV